MKREKLNDSYIVARIPSVEKAQIQALVNEGKYLNLSHAVRSIVKRALEARSF